MMNQDQSIGPINLGNPNEFTILDLAQLVIHKLGSRNKVEQKPLPQDDPKQRQPDITLARTLLNWEPKIMLDQGLSRTIDYFKAKLAVPPLAP